MADTGPILSTLSTPENFAAGVVTPRGARDARLPTYRRPAFRVPPPSTMPAAMAPVRTIAGEGRLAQRTEARPVSGEARLCLRDVGHCVAAESESVVGAGL